MASIASLPPELLHKILECLLAGLHPTRPAPAHIRSVHSLFLTAALVHSSWTPSCQALLVRSLFIDHCRTGELFLQEGAGAKGVTERLEIEGGGRDLSHQILGEGVQDVIKVGPRDGLERLLICARHVGESRRSSYRASLDWMRWSSPTNPSVVRRCPARALLTLDTDLTRLHLRTRFTFIDEFSRLSTPTHFHLRSLAVHCPIPDVVIAAILRGSADTLTDLELSIDGIDETFVQTLDAFAVLAPTLVRLRIMGFQDPVEPFLSLLGYCASMVIFEYGCRSPSLYKVLSILGSTTPLPLPVAIKILLFVPMHDELTIEDFHSCLALPQLRQLHTWFIADSIGGVKFSEMEEVDVLQAECERRKIGLFLD